MRLIVVKGWKKLFLRVNIIVLLVLIMVVSIKINRGYQSIGGSAKNDLLESIVLLEGDEYSKKMIGFDTIRDNEIYIYEDMKIIIEREKKCEWDDSMPLTDLEGNEFSRIYGMSVYRCQVIVTRYASINSEIINDSKTYKYITFIGYEDEDINSKARAMVDANTRTVSYSDTKFYYENVNEQIVDVMREYY